MKVIKIDAKRTWDGLLFIVTYKKTLFSKIITETFADLQCLEYIHVPNVNVYVTIPMQKVLNPFSKITKVLDTYRKNNIIYPIKLY